MITIEIDNQKRKKEKLYISHAKKKQMTSRYTFMQRFDNNNFVLYVFPNLR